MIDELTYAINADGTISIKVDGKPVRYAKESDLLTVKGAAETARATYEAEIAKHQTTITEANRVHEDTKQRLLQEQAAKEQLASQANEADTLKTKVGELETTLSTTNESKTNLENELLGIKRETFKTIYKVDPEKVAAMTLGQLRDAERNFAAVGFNPANPQPANYDGGGGGNNAGTAPTTVLEQCSNELKVAREQKSRKLTTGSADPDYKP